MRTGSYVTHRAGSHATFRIYENGVTSELITNENNTFTHNGIVLTFNEITTDFITIGATRDNTRVETLLRDFVEAYNELRNSLNDQVHERRARSMGSFFEPLTDEERRAMSDDEIRRWEEQARTGLMHRNDALMRTLDQMRRQLFNAVELADGTTFSLAQLGIAPSNDHQARGALVIDETRFAAAVAQHADRVIEMFTTQNGLGERMHNIIDDATNPRTGTITRRAGQTGGGGVWAATNNLTREINRQEQRIEAVMQQLARREDALFRKFSRMEQAMIQSDSQMNFMFQMFMQ
jgi:flagellar hook-associated protein 2